MSSLNVLSWNLNGLNSAIKCASCLDTLARYQVEVVILQETHLNESDISRLENQRYRVAAFSPALNKTKGVAIIIDKRLKISIIGKGNDLEGRISFLKCTYNGTKIAIVSVYTPNCYESNFFQSLSDILMKLSDFQLIIGADMNAVIDPMFDKSKPVNCNPRSSNALRHILSDFNLTDAWRVYNPGIKEFTFYSNRHASFSRIDFILITTSLFSSTKRIQIQPMSLSDHHAYICQFQFSELKKKATRWRFNCTLLDNPTFCEQFKSELDFFLKINGNSVEDFRVLWDAIKGFIRNNSIAFASGLNKSQLKKISELEYQLSALEFSQQRNYSPRVALTLSKVKTDLNILIAKRAEFAMHRARVNHYFYGNRPSQFLANKLRNNDHLINMSTILSEDGKLLTDPNLINSRFTNFYKKLYTSEGEPSAERIDSFLKGLNLPILSETDSCSLGNPLTLYELRAVLETMNKGKAPGWDGIPPEFYLKFWTLLGPLLLEMINTAILKGSFGRDVNTSLISLLLKKCKDSNQCSNWRPLSLINTDVKLFSKVLSHRLERFLPKLIHPDQSGFVKKRLSSDNVRRLLHIINSSSLQASSAVLSVDAEKAFDRLEWSYLWRVLKYMGLGERFMNMVKILFANPSASLLTDNICSPSFKITCGSRQGDPISPILFILSMEPLAQFIRQSEYIKPISVHSTNHHISLYADDILLFLQDTSHSLSTLLDIFNNFSAISSYKINWSKSSLMFLKILPECTSIQGIPILNIWA